MKIIFYSILCAGAVALILTVTHFGIRMHTSQTLVKNARPYSVERGPGASRILILGDSLGVGVGATEQRYSIAGRLAAEYPDVSIINRSVSGAKLEDIAEHLLMMDEKYDVIYLHAGANDVIRYTGLAELQATLKVLFAEATKKSTAVVMMQSGSVGFAPLFPAPLDLLYTWRTARAYIIAKDEAQKAGVLYVDLYRERAADPFLEEPERFFADDGLHPSDEGYRVWFELLAKALEENRLLQ